MSRAFTLMTAMPPTVGHLHLMQFVASMSDYLNKGRVIVCTQPHEPFALERFDAIRKAAHGLQVDVFWLKDELPQDPATDGFWEMWEGLMRGFGMKEGDTFVSSEPYGAHMADIFKGTFIPYDPQRELFPVKATPIREGGLRARFHEIMPEFQHNLRAKVTIFGAESTGKTTLSKELAAMTDSHWLYEWARPYLETVGPEIHLDSMNAIWKGQLAAQRHTRFWYDKPALIQDTDLFSTVGYWEQPHWEQALGPVPEGLIKDAHETKSDLYIITRSNIPFERDTIRYGVDKRESPDEFWIGIAEKYGLNYIVLDSDNAMERLSQAMWAVRQEIEKKQELISYDRSGF